MKRVYASLLGLFLAPLSLHASFEQGETLCQIIDHYHQGSLHYLDCLNHVKKMDPELNLVETVDYVCSAVHTFWNLEDKKFDARCYADAAQEFKL